MDNEALKIVRDYIDEHLDKSDPIPIYDVYMVWKCKTLQNWKYMISSTLHLGNLYWYHLGVQGPTSPELGCQIFIYLAA